MLGLLAVVDSVAAGRRLQIRGLSACGAGPWLPCGTRDLAGPGVEALSPALAGRSLTTGPPGKSLNPSDPGRTRDLLLEDRKHTGGGMLLP